MTATNAPDYVTEDLGGGTTAKQATIQHSNPGVGDLWDQAQIPVMAGYRVDTKAPYTIADDATLQQLIALLRATLKTSLTGLSALPSPSGVTATVTGTPGGSPVIYAVVGVNANGDTVPTPASAVNAPSPTGSSNYVTVAWNDDPGCASYKVLKNGLLLATGVPAGSTSYVDNAGAGTTSYTQATSNPLATLPVQITSIPNLNISNFPATQTVAGAVAVSNLPSTQTIAGTVGVSSIDESLAPSKPGQTALSANTAAGISVPAGVKQVAIFNYTAGTLNRDYTGAATAGDLAIPPGGGVVDNVKSGTGLTLSLLCSVAASMNGNSAGGVVVEFGS